MLLRTKLGLIVAGVVIALALVDAAILKNVVAPSFQTLETKDAEEDLARVQHAIENEVEHLDRLCHDWSAWDDTYQFIADGNQAYLDANLTQTTLANAELFLVYHVDKQGRVVSRVLNDSLAGEPACAIADCPPEQRAPDNLLQRTRGKDDRLTGLMSTECGLLLFSSRSIVTSDESAEPNGCLLMARLLDDTRVKKLADQTRVEFSIAPLGPSASLTDMQQTSMRALESGEPIVAISIDEATMNVAGLVRDHSGVAIGLVEARVPRAVSAEGRKALDFALASTLIAAVLVLLVILFLLDRAVVKPLQRLSDHATLIGKNPTLTTRLFSARRDEIGILAGTLDVMVDRLDESRARLVDSAHSAGMSEVATEVLHDVGNVLNSANVSAQQLEARVKSSRSADVVRLAGLFAVHKADLARFLTEDARGQQVPAFVEALGSAITTERESLLAECQSLTESMDHMRELVVRQQDRATLAIALEPVSLQEQLELALRISHDPRDAEIEFVRSFEPLPPVLVAKHRLLQILVNLLKNARQSVHDSKGLKRIELVVGSQQAATGDRVRIEVRDSGLGIEPENLTLIFAQGHTTKRGGHGFGLHNSANAAGEMSGSLHAESLGRGHGATFVLELPLKSPAEAA